MRLMLTTECQCKLVWPSPNPTVSSRCCFPSTQQEGFRHFSALFAGVAFLLAKAVIVTQAPYPLSPTLNTDPESSSEVNVKIFLKIYFYSLFWLQPALVWCLLWHTGRGFSMQHVEHLVLLIHDISGATH